MHTSQYLSVFIATDDVEKQVGIDVCQQNKKDTVSHSKDFIILIKRIFSQWYVRGVCQVIFLVCIVAVVP